MKTNGILPKAVKMTKRELSLIRRKKVLKGYAETAKRLIATIDSKLNPKIDVELKELKADKATIVISGQAVEISKFSRLSTKYKDIADECLGAKILDKMLKAEDGKGNLLYRTESITRRATVLGPATI